VPAGAAIRILLVEDNPGDARLVEILLSEASSSTRFELVHAERLEEAIDYLGKAEFDVILLDLSLPDSGDLETVSRTREAAPRTSLVVLSGRDDQEIALRALQQGAQDYLVKGRGSGDTIARVIRYSIERQNAEEALRTSEERFRSLVRYASDIIVVLDADGKILYESPAAEKILGLKPEQRVGSSVFDRVHPDDVGWIRDKLARLLEAPRERTSMWYRIRDENGSWHLFEGIATNLLHDPAAKGIVVNIRDITERRELEQALREREELYRSVVDQAAETIFLIDLETKLVLESNAALHRSLGYTAQELKHMTLYDIVAHDRESTDRNIGRVLEKGHYYIGERKYRRKDGRLVDMVVSASALSYGDRERHGGREALCVVARDMTENPD
jgi:PAS domain S-box-containing protein